jgi:hypothetical protein
LELQFSVFDEKNALSGKSADQPSEAITGHGILQQFADVALLSQG